MFRDQGACATLLSVHVFYVTCPSVVTSLASFPETAAGPEITSIVQRDGVCVANSTASEAGRPSYLCKADGSWYFLSGECHCLPGYQPHNDTSRCIGNASRQSHSLCTILVNLADLTFARSVIGYNGIILASVRLSVSALWRPGSEYGVESCTVVLNCFVTVRR